MKSIFEYCNNFRYICNMFDTVIAKPQVKLNGAELSLIVQFFTHPTLTEKVPTLQI